MYEISYIIKIIKRYHFSNRLSWRVKLHIFLRIFKSKKSIDSIQIENLRRTNKDYTYNTILWKI